MISQTQREIVTKVYVEACMKRTGSFPKQGFVHFGRQSAIDCWCVARTSELTELSKEEVVDILVELNLVRER